jgi:hypothetical protein
LVRTFLPQLNEFLLGPAKSFKVTSVFVALVLTAALEFWSEVLRNSIRARNDRPAMPNSMRAELIQATASANTFGAFCLESGSYAVKFAFERTPLSPIKG